MVPEYELDEIREVLEWPYRILYLIDAAPTASRSLLSVASFESEEQAADLHGKVRIKDGTICAREKYSAS